MLSNHHHLQELVARQRKIIDSLDDTCRELESYLMCLEPRASLKERIVALREADATLTQQAIAERVGTSPNYVWMVLNKRRLGQVIPAMVEP